MNSVSEISKVLVVITIPGLTVLGTVASKDMMKIGEPVEVFDVWKIVEMINQAPGGMSTVMLLLPMHGAIKALSRVHLRPDFFYFPDECGNLENLSGALADVIQSSVVAGAQKAGIQLAPPGANFKLPPRK